MPDEDKNFGGSLVMTSRENDLFIARITQQLFRSTQLKVRVFQCLITDRFIN